MIAHRSLALRGSAVLLGTLLCAAASAQSTPEAGPWRYGASDQWRRDNAEPSEWNECENVPGTPRTFRVD